MRALLATPNGPEPAELRDIPAPTPAADEALLEVRAASLNRGELMLLARRPDWGPGQDVAGVVVEPAADGSGPPAGTPVVAMVEQGGWAERVGAPTSRLAALPDGVRFGEAATLGVAAMTALRALREAGVPLLGSRVLVTGASGGVGRYGVQLASLAGADVTAVARDAGRAEGLLELGASRVVLETEDLPGPFDVVLEGVGGASLERSVRALGTRGVAMLYAATDPEPARIGLFDFLAHAGAGARIQGFGVYRTPVETFGADLGYLAGLVAAGKLRPPVGLEVSWRDLATATEALRNRQVNGKVVLTID
jgi:NADPH:quinone reductase